MAVCDEICVPEIIENYRQQAMGIGRSRCPPFHRMWPADRDKSGVPSHPDPIPRRGCVMGPAVDGVVVAARAFELVDIGREWYAAPRENRHDALHREAERDI